MLTIKNQMYLCMRFCGCSIILEALIGHIMRISIDQLTLTIYTVLRQRPNVRKT